MREFCDNPISGLINIRNSHASFIATGLVDIDRDVATDVWVWEDS